MDFEHVIHECGGGSDVLPKLLTGICRLQEMELYVLVPPARPALLQALAPWSRGVATGCLGLALSRGRVSAEFYLEGLDSV